MFYDAYSVLQMTNEYCGYMNYVRYTYRLLVHSYMTNSFTIKPFNSSYAFQQSIDTRI